MMMIHHHLFTFNRFFTIFIFVPRLLKPPRTIFLHIRSQTPSIFVCLCCFSRSVKLFNTRNPRSLKVTPRNYFQEKDRFQRLFYSDITSSYHFFTDSNLHTFMTLNNSNFWESAWFLQATMSQIEHRGELVLFCDSGLFALHTMHRCRVNLMVIGLKYNEK